MQTIHQLIKTANGTPTIHQAPAINQLNPALAVDQSSLNKDTNESSTLHTMMSGIRRDSQGAFPNQFGNANADMLAAIMQFQSTGGMH